MQTGKPLILIADDDMLPRSVLRDLLRPHYETLLVRDSGEAKLHYQRNIKRIAAVITDAQMVDNNGVALASWLLGQSESVPIVVTTRRGTPEATAAREIWSSPGVSWLDKPFSIAETHSLLERLANSG